MLTEIEKFTFESRSSNAIYEVTKWADGTYSCNCPGWKFKRGDAPRICKHIQSLSAGKPIAKMKCALCGYEGPMLHTEDSTACKNLAAAKMSATSDVPAFFKPMLAHPINQAFPPSGKSFKADLQKRLTELGKATDWIAEPKFDGKRAIVFVEKARTAACYSRLGNSAIDNGTGWLKSVKWPWPSAVLDGELCSGGGVCVAGKTVQQARSTAGLDLDLMVFDMIAFGGVDLKQKPWADRRVILESALKDFNPGSIFLTPYSQDPALLWKNWVDGFGGEGIMLKRRDSIYVPGQRSPSWVKVKMEATIDVVVLGTTNKTTYNGSRGYRTGEVALTYGYYDKKSKSFVAAGQGIKVGSEKGLKKFIGCVAEMRCAGVTTKGALRSGHFLRWRTDKPTKECVVPGR